MQGACSIKVITDVADKPQDGFDWHGEWLNPDSRGRVKLRMFSVVLVLDNPDNWSTPRATLYTVDADERWRVIVRVQSRTWARARLMREKTAEAIASSKRRSSDLKAARKPRMCSVPEAP